MIDWGDRTTLDNWITSENGHFFGAGVELRCASDWQIGLFGALFFLGYVFGNFIVKLGDTVGRITILRLSNNCGLIIFGLIIFVSHNIYLTYFLYFMFGFFNNVRVSLAFIYGQEIVDPHSKYSYMFSSMYNIVDAFIMIVASLYFMYISKNWYCFEVASFLLVLGSCIASYILPETPRYLLSQGKIEEAIQSFNYIAWFNGRPIIDTQKETVLVEDELLKCGISKKNSSSSNVLLT